MNIIPPGTKPDERIYVRVSRLSNGIHIDESDQETFENVPTTLDEIYAFSVDKDWNVSVEFDAYRFRNPWIIDQTTGNIYYNLEV